MGVVGATTEGTLTAPGPSRGSRAVTRLLELLLAVVVASAAVVSGYNWVDGDKRLAVLPVVAVVAIAMGILALTRFSVFVLIILAVRPILDALKLSGSTTGTTVGNTAANRGLDPSSIVGVLFLVAAILWLAGRVRSGRFIGGSRVQLAMGAFIVACVVSVAGSQHAQASALECLRIGTVLMMFVVLNQLITSRAMMTKVIGACYAGMCGPLLYTAYGFLLGHPESELKGGFTRITGPFSQSNTFARYLAFLVVFGVAIYPYAKRWWKAALGAILLVGTVFLLLTVTRTAIIGALVGIVLLAWTQRRKAVGLGLVVVMAGALLVPGVAGRFAALSDDTPTTSSAGGATGNSLIWRLNYWTEVLPLANRNPVTGIGLNGTQYETDVEKQPHNDVIRAYVETGAFGLLAYLSMLLALVGVGRRAMGRAARGTLEHAVGAGSMAVSVTFVLGSLAANVMSNVVTLFSVVAFAACASYVSRSQGASITDHQRMLVGAPRS
ncbi:O-antigen ligase family protein [Lapillicoccus jejuensis]|uniref:O-antigen ligase-like membrane protein n=1 Tax=Lapillicoccus jejuensis TaxID=402171 RepID=A0A542E1G7_9MICO|nr:O-antigen ligase family protein [Lapillicoccus jejuensis]TQJ09186.1 O-antigen ligase-like membrane protein [Lapillicoccus jejuensis]